MEIKKNVKVMKFGEEDSNGNVFSKENIKLPKEKVNIYESDFDETEPPIGEAYNFRAEDGYLFCDMTIEDNKGYTVAPKMTVYGKTIDEKGVTSFDNFELNSLSLVPIHAVHELTNNLKPILTREEALKIIDETETDLDIKHRVIEGLVKLNRNVKKLDFAAEHDILYVCDFEEPLKHMTKEDVEYLAKRGFFEEEDSWAFFT